MNTVPGARSRHDLPTVAVTTVAQLLAVDPPRADEALDDLVSAALGRHPAPEATEIEALPVSLGSPATGGVYRVHGLDRAAAPWSLFCKVLQHVRHWTALAHLPPAQATHFADSYPWRSELELWDARVQASLPEGLRSPGLHRLVELPDDRLAIWQEDVPLGEPVWDDARFQRAAHLLGRWNARSTTPDVLAVSTFPPGFALRMYAENAVAARGLGALSDHELWSHPWLAADRDLAATLTRLGETIPAMLDRLDTFTQTLPHGDASPQNLLVPPAADAAEFVAIDVSFRTPHALGFDLGQLLVGLVHADVIAADRLPTIADVIVPAYVAGLAAEGLDEPTERIREALATSALLRSGFDGFLYAELASDAPPTPAFTQRIALARFLVQHYLDAASPR